MFFYCFKFFVDINNVLLFLEWKCSYQVVYSLVGFSNVDGEFFKCIFVFVKGGRGSWVSKGLFFQFVGFGIDEIFIDVDSLIIVLLFFIDIYFVFIILS